MTKRNPWETLQRSLRMNAYAEREQLERLLRSDQAPLSIDVLMERLAASRPTVRRRIGELRSRGVRVTLEPGGYIIRGQG